MKIPTEEEQRERMSAGREAGLVLRVAAPIFDEQFEAIIVGLINDYRAHKLSGEMALMAVAGMAAIYDVREELMSRVQMGEAAAAEIHGVTQGS